MPRSFVPRAVISRYFLGRISSAGTLSARGLRLGTGGNCAPRRVIDRARSSNPKRSPGMIVTVPPRMFWSGFLPLGMDDPGRWATKILHVGAPIAGVV